MVRSKLLVFGFLTLMAFVVSSTQASENGPSAAGELAELLSSYKSYEASFIQIVVDGNNQRVQETRGKLKAKRPGLFYWETSAPLSQFIVSDGNTVEVYDPDLEQVTVHKLDSNVSSTPALLLSGEVDNLNDSYEVSVKRLGESTREFTLIPRDEDSLFTSLRLMFSNDELHEMRMKDSLSQLSVLSFNEIEINGPMQDSAFSLDYPEGVDVIRDGA